jgi:hypothetical protein
MFKKLLLALLMTVCPLAAQQTPNLHFNIPAQGTQNWGTLINSNFSSLDLLLSGNSAAPAFKISGAFTISSLPSGTLCLHSINGVVSTTLSDCGNASGSMVTVNGGSSLSTANFGNLPVAQANNILAIWQNAGNNVSAEVPYATSGAFGVVKPDNTTITISGGVISSVSAGDAITSPNSTLSVGGSSTNTTLDLLGAAGKIMAGATPALTATPTIGLSGTSGKWTFAGSSSGSAAISVAAAAGSPSTWLLPSTDPTNGQVLQAGTPSGGNVQLSWATGAGSGVSSFSGDGNLLSNSSSTGAVTASLANAGAHKWWGNNTGSTAAPGYQSIGTADLPAQVVLTNQANTYTAGGQNFGSGGPMTLPNGPGLTLTAQAQIGYDTTAKNYQGENSTSQFSFLGVLSGTTVTDGDCPVLHKNGSGQLTVGDAGAPCGTGGTIALTSPNSTIAITGSGSSTLTVDQQFSNGGQTLTPAYTATGGLVYTDTSSSYAAAAGVTFPTSWNLIQGNGQISMFRAPHAGFTGDQAFFAFQEGKQAAGAIGIDLCYSNDPTSLGRTGYHGFICDFTNNSERPMVLGTAVSAGAVTIPTAGTIPRWIGGSVLEAIDTSELFDNGGGMTIGSPTGGAQGAGTLNATGLYINGVAAGGGGSPGGSNTQAQYNSSSSFAGSTWTYTGTGGNTYTAPSGGSLSLNGLAAGSFTWPVATAGTATSSLQGILDSTNKNWHIWNGTRDMISLGFAAASPPTSGDCATLTKVGGTEWQITDAGAPCGTHNTSHTVSFDGGGAALNSSANTLCTFTSVSGTGSGSATYNYSGCTGATPATNMVMEFTGFAASSGANNITAVITSVVASTSVTISCSGCVNETHSGTGAQSTEITCVAAPESGTWNKVGLRVEGANASTTGSGTIQPAFVSDSTYISSGYGLANLTLVGTPIVLSAAYGSDTTISQSLTGPNQLCFVGANFSNAVRLKVNATIAATN